MIVVYVGAGLANRMFQYAFYRGLKNKGLNVFIDEKSFKPRWKFETTLLNDAFPQLEMTESNSKTLKFFCEDGKFQKLYKSISFLIPDFKYILGWELNYHPNIHKKATKHCTYCGFWLSEKYFSDCKDDVRSNFKFRPFDEEQNIQISCIMELQNSVAIHVRKGPDYLANPNTKDICSIIYYKNAIKYISDKVRNPVYYVFTDNKQWVIENFKGINYILIDWNPVSGNRSFRDMQLMSCAKHNIIANSTYSWWGAWLNNNPDKIIISPKLWFEGLMKDNSDVLPNSWIKI